jgi:hypothetical protein
MPPGPEPLLVQLLQLPFITLAPAVVEPVHTGVIVVPPHLTVPTW